MRILEVTITGGSWIRIAHAVTSVSNDLQDPDDCLYVAVYWS